MSRRGRFTVAREPIELELGGDLFHAPSIVAPEILAEMLEVLSQVASAMPTTTASPGDIKVVLKQAMKLLDDVFGLILAPESADRFRTRLHSRDNPFDLFRELMPALEWLVEEYADRPTQPSPPSTTGLSDGESSSTSGASNGVSIPLPSPRNDGATPLKPPSTT